MKKIGLFILLTLSMLVAEAQQIDSIVFTPSAPTTTDPITFYVHLRFPQSSCADVATVSTVGNSIHGYAFHCMGMLTTTCNDVDTITLAPLPVGTYTFDFTLDAGYGPPGNCTPGILPYDVDTVFLNVTLASGLSEQQVGSINIYPNPVSEQFKVELKDGIIAKAEIINLLGNEVMNFEPNAPLCDISVAELAEGIYFCRVTDAADNVHIRQVEVVR